MRYNNTFKVTETPTIVLPIAINYLRVKAYKYSLVDGLILVDLVVDKQKLFNFFTLTNVEADTYYIIVYTGGFEVIRVGNPPISYFAYCEDVSITELPYTQYDYTGNIIKSGTLTKLTDYVYGMLITETVKSFVTTDNTLTTITLPSKFILANNYSQGEILLQRGRWQLIAIPEAGKVKDIFLDRLAKQEGVEASSMIDFVSAYPGSVNKYLTYVPGFTSTTSEHNFDLMLVDAGHKEITGFWVKCKEWSHTTSDIVFSWSNTESEVV